MTAQLYDLRVVYVRQIPTYCFSSASCLDEVAGCGEGGGLTDAKLLNKVIFLHIEECVEAM